jgi:hypothetical protein
MGMVKDILWQSISGKYDNALLVGQFLDATKPGQLLIVIVMEDSSFERARFQLLICLSGRTQAFTEILFKTECRLLCLDSLENLCSCSFPLILNDVPMK